MKREEWVVVCANVSARSCDFSGQDLLYWGKFQVRVRAHASGNDSEWVSLRFKPDNDGESRGLAGSAASRGQSMGSHP